MKENTFFTIIVPVYNCEEYIEDCIKSILDQTFKDFELILINDGSVDKSGEICKKYKDKDKRIIYISQENSGQAVARNKALDIAKGKYIVFIDSDDWVYSNYLEVCYNIFEKEKVDLIAFPGVFSSFNREENYAQNNNNHYNIRKLSNQETMKCFATTKTIKTAICYNIYSMKVWDSIRFPKVRCKEDAYVMHQILAKCENIALCDTDYYFYYLRQDSTERKKFTKDRLISIEIGKKCTEFYKENYPDFYYYAYCNIYMLRQKNILIEIIDKNALNEYKEEFRKVYLNLRNDIHILNNDNKFNQYKSEINIQKTKLWAYHPYIVSIIHKIKKYVKERI